MRITISLYDLQTCFDKLKFVQESDMTSVNHPRADVAGRKLGVTFTRVIAENGSRMWELKSDLRIVSNYFNETINI